MKLPTETIEWTRAVFENRKLYLAKTATGICYIGRPDESFEEFSASIAKKYKNSLISEDSKALAPYISELHAYFNGFSQIFSLPIDVKGTPFQESIWQALRDIPFGNTASYSDIAHRINRPTAVRAVGAAIGANPVLISIPCHRVIGKNGTMTGYRGGLDFKQFLLELEKGKIAKTC